MLTSFAVQHPSRLLALPSYLSPFPRQFKPSIEASPYHNISLPSNVQISEYHRSIASTTPRIITLHIPKYVDSRNLPWSSFVALCAQSPRRYHLCHSIRSCDHGPWLEDGNNENVGLSSLRHWWHLCVPVQDPTVPRYLPLTPYLLSVEEIG